MLVHCIHSCVVVQIQKNLPSSLHKMVSLPLQMHNGSLSYLLWVTCQNNGRRLENMYRSRTEGDEELRTGTTLPLPLPFFCEAITCFNNGEP
jgi:hypothetical protein